MGRSDLVRLVRGLRGRVAMCVEFVLRFDYGSLVPWVEQLPEGGISAIGGPERVVLRTPVALRGEDLKTVGEFEIGAGETIPFVLTYGPSHQPPPRPVDAERALHNALSFWRQWSDQCAPAGPWTDTVKRSLVVLKGLTFAPTGGIVAAPTTSLPEQVGGPRNWDYRYCWLRDATFTLLALMNAGYSDEARAWRDWLFRAVAGSPDQIQIMYGLGGERRLTEWEVPWLPGYEGSHPVRIGNDAATQIQLDIYGELFDAFYHTDLHGLAPANRAPAIGQAILGHLAEIWDQPDEGIWEVRGPPQHFTHSKAMAWVAFDRAIKISERLGDGASTEHWRKIRDQIHADVCAKAFDPKLGSFVQAYGSKALDASLLLLPLGRLSAALRPAHDRHGQGDRTAPPGRRVRAALRHRQGRRRAAARRRGVSRLQLLARRQLHPAGPHRRGAGAVRTPVGAQQRCRALGRGIRPARRNASSGISRRRFRMSRWSIPPST